jgi:hypothetical protein
VHGITNEHIMHQFPTSVLLKSVCRYYRMMQILQRPAGDDGSWTIVDFEETRVTKETGPLFKCILHSYRSFNPYDKYNSPYSVVFQPKLARFNTC